MANSALCCALFEQLFMDTVYTGFPILCFQSNGTQNSKKKKKTPGIWGVTKLVSERRL